MFNREVQKAKRRFWKKKQVEIEQLETSDQKSFWKEIGRIGIGQERKKDIPTEVKLANGEVRCKPEDVSSKMFYMYGEQVSKTYLIKFVYI